MTVKSTSQSLMLLLQRADNIDVSPLLGIQRCPLNGSKHTNNLPEDTSSFVSSYRSLHSRVVFCEGCVNECFEFHREESEDKIHRPSDQLERRGTQPGKFVGLASSEVIKGDVVRKSDRGIIDEEEVRNKNSLAVH